MTFITVLLFASLAMAAAPQWQEVELTFTASRDTANPYTDTEAWADFTHEDGTKIRRPMFWDGGRTFRVRFASMKSSGTWRWTTSDHDGDPGLRGRSGTLAAGPAASAALLDAVSVEMLLQWDDKQFIRVNSSEVACASD